MMRPYKRIVIMHMTIIFGAFALFISGFKSAVFIIIWIGLKIFFDLKIHVSDIKNYGFKVPQPEAINSTSRMAPQHPNDGFKDSDCGI